MVFIFPANNISIYVAKYLQFITVNEIFSFVWGMAVVFSHWAKQLKNKRLDDFLVSFTVIC